MEFRDLGISICELHCTNPSASFRRALATLGELKKNAHSKLRGLSRGPCCPSASSRPDERGWQALQALAS